MRCACICFALRAIGLSWFLRLRGRRHVQPPASCAPRFIPLRFIAAGAQSDGCIVSAHLRFAACCAAISFTAAYGSKVAACVCAARLASHCGRALKHGSHHACAFLCFHMLLSSQGFARTTDCKPLRYLQRLFLRLLKAVLTFSRFAL